MTIEQRIEDLSKRIAKANEGNPCHNPAGSSTGGEFCGTKGGGGGGRISSSTESHVVVFHGTAAKMVESIKEHGLRAGVGHGASQFAGFTERSAVRRKSVFMTPDEGLAKIYASKTVKLYQNVNPDARAVVLEIHVPKEAYKNFRKDTASSNAVYFPGVIPPSWITDYTEVMKRDSVVVYVVVVADGYKTK